MAATQDLPQCVKGGLSASVKYMVSNFIADKHYTKIGVSLSAKWDKFQSLTAAMKLMEQHGVVLEPDEESRLSQMSEAQMIETLVSKMPQQSKEQFQHFFLQLQLIVSTATRVRTALEQGRADLVEAAMDDADSTGIAQYILKMSIVQAGSEVKNLKNQHNAWVKDAEAKMSKLIKGQEDKFHAKDRLDKAMGDLAIFTTTQNENIKKVLMAFAGGSATALLHGVFSSWGMHTKKMRVENAIYEEYREEIEAVEARLIDAKAGQLKGVKSMIERRNATGGVNLMQEVFGIWKDEILEAKFGVANREEIAKMEARLKTCADHQAESAKKVLARCGAMSEEGMRDMCWHEWRVFHNEYAKEKEFNDAVKAEEQKIAAFKKKHTENAHSCLNNMHAATETGLLHEVLSNWVEFWKEEKQVNAYAELMQGQNNKLGGFGARNKKGAQSVMERAHEHNLLMLYLKVFGAWRLDQAMERTAKIHQARIDGKRQQLGGVQKMFRDFAKQLEENINKGMDSNRDLTTGPPASYKQKGSSRKMQKSEGSVSLPDINAKQGSQYGGSSRSR